MKARMLFALLILLVAHRVTARTGHVELGEAELKLRPTKVALSGPELYRMKQRNRVVYARNDEMQIQLKPNPEATTAANRLASKKTVVVR